MTATQPQSLRVTATWRRTLRIWLAKHDLTGVGDIATTAATTLLQRDHGTNIYVPPRTGEQRVNFSIPDALHNEVLAAVIEHPDTNKLYAHGIRSVRDFYLVALDQHITEAAVSDHIAL